MSAFNDLREIAPLRIWPGLIARALTGAKATLAQIELEPNVDVPEHAHVNEQIGILAGGSLTFRIGDESRDLRPGATWIIPAHVPHSVTAGPEGAALIEVFVPARDDWADREVLEPRAPTGF
ncbi:MAG TPA: cupin domain-containing protein [Gaiellaceae bacterium]